MTSNFARAALAPREPLRFRRHPSNMSVVKVQQEVVRVAEKKTEEVAHRVGERLTGGKTTTGYLAVWPSFPCLMRRFF